jgi:hypothetical protein
MCVKLLTIPTTTRDGEYFIDAGGASECMFAGDAAANNFQSNPEFPQPILNLLHVQHTMRPSTSAEEKSLRMFATRKIIANDLILIERPILMAPSRRQKCYHTWFGMRDHRFFIQRDPAGYENLVEMLFKKLTPKMQLSLAKLDCTAEEGGGPISKIMETNGFDLLLPSELEFDMLYICVFKDLSRLRHR